MAKEKPVEVEKEVVVEEVVDGREIIVEFRSHKGNAGMRTFTDKKSAQEFAKKFDGTIV